MREDLSTYDLAKALGMSERTICHLIDRGRMPGWRVSSKGARRTSWHQAMRYCRENGVPTARLEKLARERGLKIHGLNPTLLLMAPNASPLSELSGAGYSLGYAGDLLTAHEELLARPWELVILDSAVGREDCRRLARWLVNHDPRVRLGVLADESENGAWEGFRAFRKPVSVVQVARQLSEGPEKARKR